MLKAGYHAEMVMDSVRLSEIAARVGGVLEGDRVKVEMSPYDLSKGRVTYRYK